MVDTSKIHRLITRARRRLQLQAAAETATTASILAFAAALTVVYAVRRGAITERVGLGLLGACAVIVLVGALVGALRRIPTHIVATRIDRASHLSDRLSSACAFEQQFGDTSDEHTAAFMRAAITDAVRALPRADIKAATPFRPPRDLRAAGAFGLVAALVAGLYWPGGGIAGPITDPDLRAQVPAERTEQPDQFEEEDLDYARDLLEDLRRTAKTDREPNLEKFVNEVETLLAKAELGELTKEQLLEELTKAEQRFMEGSEEDVKEALSDLEETGKQLKKDKLTRELGTALEQGDLEKARQEFEKLAQKLENNELSESDRQKLAKALEKAADQFQQKQTKREQRMDQQIADKKRQLQKLQRKQDEAKSEKEKRRLAERIKKQKRELKKLEREKQRQQQSAQKRTLKQLHREMKQASQQMKQKDAKSQRMASRNLRNASRDTGKVNADKRKIAAQKKVASQLSDLKEAMRRARRRGRQGQRDLFGKNRRNQDFRRRARGQRGQRSAWRPGQGKQGKQGQQPGGKGKQGGKSYGDQHDPYLMGDATPKSGNTKDQSVSGVHGKGPSRRETILSAAQKGFSSQSYKKVYAEYKDIVEEVMRTEKVPSGYKYYVKRYFQKIKPHAMD